MSEDLSREGVVTVAEAERSRVFASLASAFSADPLMRWFFPEAADFINAATGEFYDAFGGGAVGAATAYRTAGFEGAALWYPPGMGPDEERLVASMATTVRPEIHEDCLGLMEGMEKHHPEEDHWYLAVLGVDHAYQGRGYGAQLMKHALTKIDALGMTAYLESSNPLNMSLYKRHGFEEMGSIQSGSSPAIVPMLREARA
ncbi:GNAT family N-acetyltransferase [Congregibacter litoralis]|uniref:Acetyltransferase n=1 Tax=Congregibacter litoralis KT71 TaxID=314285 RepID=A4A5V3_9GAMM|nr:GNAT family N-acetyltransferase [Congregibacter litoralis]EAQ98400.1 Acetyltransferase [Congregibacter litoralis KT71]